MGCMINGCSSFYGGSAVSSTSFVRDFDPMCCCTCLLVLGGYMLVLLCLRIIVPTLSSMLGVICAYAFGCGGVEVGLGQNHGVRQVHQPRRTSNFFLVAIVGWCTRRQAALWLKAWWCMVAHARVLHCVLYLVSKHRI